ncbi:DUF72 domain-containing protein [bacterium]|nr:DUF72 domain-containing protein [bacterium]
MIYIGTSGFSYADWKGRFYPEKISQQDMLAYYARHFSACEINASYYRIPSAAMMVSMLRKSSGQVRFVVKAHQSMTHQRTAATLEYRAFQEALKPLQAAGCLGAVLIQFPYSFPNNLENRGYLADLKERLRTAVPLVVEFRHKSWASQIVRTFLKEMMLGTVNVDEPDIKNLLSPNDQVTNTVGYIRFHGRNKETWYKKDAEPWERYNYLYTETELADWVPRISRIDYLAKETFVFFNNHWQSQAVVNAKQLGGLLDKKT